MPLIIVEPVAKRLLHAGCRAFFVASACEAVELSPHVVGTQLFVLSNILAVDLDSLTQMGAIPVLNTPAMVAAMPSGKPCALMIDTGMNRVGLTAAEFGTLNLETLNIVHIMSHLASADVPDDPMNARQLAAFRSVRSKFPNTPASFASSAGIHLGPEYHFDMVRPGLALYGGQSGPLGANVHSVIHAEAQVLQCHMLGPGDAVGYNGTWIAKKPTKVATLGIGYADGYGRDFSNAGKIVVAGALCPVIGRISMDMTTVDVTDAPVCQPGDWATLIGGPITLANASQSSGISQYELLTRLGGRYDRRYIG